MIKMFCGETKPSKGHVWRHQNMRVAYVAQHAFHHLEKHLDETPNECNCPLVKYWMYVDVCAAVPCVACADCVCGWRVCINVNTPADIQWRYSSGEDRELSEQEGKKVTEQEEEQMRKVHSVRNEDGTVRLHHTLAFTSFFPLKFPSNLVFFTLYPSTPNLWISVRALVATR